MKYSIFTKEFPNDNQAIVLRTEVDPDPVLVIEALQLPEPSGVLLLAGGAGRIPQELMGRLAPLFSTIAGALVEAGTTVIDGGTQAGVMKLIGEALAKAGRTAPHIGVLPAYAEVDPSGEHAEQILEPNHSHFVLIESEQWGIESKTISELVTHLSSRAPSLVLLVNGGEIALQDIEWNINDGREVIVLGGSGRLCDEISTVVLNPYIKSRPRIERLIKSGYITLIDRSTSPDELAEFLKYKLQNV
jgi:hypothetical protein